MSKNPDESHQRQFLESERKILPTFVVDLAVPVDVGLSYHLINLFVCQLLPEIGHHVTKLSSTWKK